MPELRLSKLPDRTPVKISISVTPDLHAALTAYADAYQTAYGSAETVAELIPYMLATFIESDSAFRKARRGVGTTADGDGRGAPKIRRRGTLAGPTPPSTSPRDGN
jgi:hypothetical protein